MLKDFFPEQLEGISLEKFYKAVNAVEPSLIRIEADEVTYSLHIILRFELELALLEGSLKVSDLPEAWNRGMEDLLGIRPRNDTEGVLQDVHWSMGVFGYFPTYALGNLYGAQFYGALKKAIPDISSRIEKGDLVAVLAWMRDQIHLSGSIYTAPELLARVTGEHLSIKAFTGYLEAKYMDVYGVALSGAGQTDEAIIAFEKSLEYNSDYEPAKEHLKNLNIN